MSIPAVAMEERLTSRQRFVFPQSDTGLATNEPDEDRTVESGGTAAFAKTDVRHVHRIFPSGIFIFPTKGEGVGDTEVLWLNVSTSSKSDYERAWLSSSTVEQRPPQTLEEQFQTVFDAAKEEIFESGTKSSLAEDTILLVNWYGRIALDIIADFVIREKVNSEIAWEVLRWIGKIQNPKTRLYRRRLLEQCLLNCRSLGAKDGAILGLASMNDPRAIPSLKKATEKEMNSEFRRDIEQVLEQLIETRRG